MRPAVSLQRLFFVVLAGIVFGQSPTGEIAGIVRDSTGALVPNAEVTSINANTNEPKSTHTDSQGQYALPQMPVGTYRIRVRQAGFRAIERKDVELSTLQNLRLDFHLEVGEVSEAVTVTAEAPQVDTRSAMQGMLVDDRRVRDLPLNGRNPIDLVRLIPGVNSVGTTIRPTF